jgi:hypothetical protein
MQLDVREYLGQHPAERSIGSGSMTVEAGPKTDNLPSCSKV